MIPWRPIAELPDELKDGREVLITNGTTASVARWECGEAEWDEPDGWRDWGDIGWGGMTIDAQPTHFAEITPP